MNSQVLHGSADDRKVMLKYLWHQKPAEEGGKQKGKKESYW